MQRRAWMVLAVGPLLAGCAVLDRMSGEGEAKRIRRVGQAADARVLEIWDTGITVNDDPVVGLEVEVRPSPPTEGAPFRAVIPKSRISRLDVPRVQPGETVAVRYDPNDPSRVALDDPPFPPLHREEGR